MSRSSALSRSNVPSRTEARELARGHDPSGSVRPHPKRQRGPGRHTPVFPETRLRVTAWPDPVLDALGHDPRSAYVEQFWLSVLGPSALFLLRRLASRLEAEPDGFDLDAEQWAAELGLGARGGQHGPFWRSLDRVCRFGAARRHGPTLQVHRRLPPLTVRQANRMPDHMRLAHEAWQAAQLERPRRRTISHWSDHRSMPRSGAGPVPAPVPVPVAAPVVDPAPAALDGPHGVGSVGAVAAEDGRDRLDQDGEVDHQ